MRKDLCEKLALEYAKLEYVNYDNETKDSKGAPPKIEKMEFLSSLFINAYNSYRNIDTSEDDNYSSELSDPDEISE